MLSSLVMINLMQVRSPSINYPVYFTLTKVTGQGGAFLGVAAAFWHMAWFMGMLISLSGVFGLLIYAVYAKRYDRVRS